MTADGNLCQTCPPVNLSLSISDTVSGIAGWTLWAGNQGLAAGTDPRRSISLAGRDYPVGEMLLSLQMTDRAGWVSTRTLRLQNTAAPLAATPTPYGHPTATAMPSFTPQAASPYATASPTPTMTPPATSQPTNLWC